MKHVTSVCVSMQFKAPNDEKIFNVMLLKNFKKTVKIVTLHSHLLFQLHPIDGDSGAKVQCQCKICYSVDIGRRMLLKN